MPEPFSEHSVLESQLNAVANAEDFIFVEDGRTVRSLPGRSDTRVIYEGRRFALDI